MAKALLFCTAAVCALTGALASARTAVAASGCAATVINDWRDGRLDGVYAARCYRQALRELPEDIRIYSSAESDIRRALVASLADPTTRKVGGVKGVVRRLASTKAKTAAQREAAQSVLAAGATSVPLTVIIAGGVAVLLVAAASFSVVARRIRRLS